MKLPELTTKYTMQLPYSKLKVKYRPWTVKEQKPMLSTTEVYVQELEKAKQLGVEIDQDRIMDVLTDINNAANEVIKACTFGNLDINSICPAELAYVLLHIRSKSVSSDAIIKKKCDSCSEESNVLIEFDKVTIINTDKHSKKIQLNDNFGVVLNYNMNSLSTSMSEIDLIAHSIDYIYNAEDMDDSKTIEQLKDWLENKIDGIYVDKIKDFLRTQPSLYYEDKFNCEHCSEENVIVINNQEDFFL